MLSLGEQIQQTFEDIAGSSIQSLQGSIEGLIKGTTTWRDALSQIGKAIGEMDVFGVKINDVVQHSMLKAMEIWEK
ncbi:MAG: hypothetical protein K0Q55_1953, partial [Verrucomicrobia bacterium]|nr:hypothetical protein [Verrucomicrobiota bacterium]